MAKAKTAVEELDFLYTPLSESQKKAAELWKQCRIMFFIGCSGVGKTTAALGMAIREALKTVNKEKHNRQKIWLSRPAVPCDEELGFTPGDLDEKLLPWLLPFHDCFGDLSNSGWAHLEKTVEIENVPVGMLRGRTISNGTLIVDEAQQLSYNQIKCIVTRLGKNARIVLCGDPDQSDNYNSKVSPLLEISRKISGLDAVGVLWFNPYDQLRDPLITEILNLI